MPKQTPNDKTNRKLAVRRAHAKRQSALPPYAIRAMSLLSPLLVQALQHVQTLSQEKK